MLLKQHPAIFTSTFTAPLRPKKYIYMCVFFSFFFYVYFCWFSDKICLPLQFHLQLRLNWTLQCVYKGQCVSCAAHGVTCTVSLHRMQGSFVLVAAADKNTHTHRQISVSYKYQSFSIRINPKTETSGIWGINISVSIRTSNTNTLKWEREAMTMEQNPEVQEAFRDNHLQHFNDVSYSNGNLTFIWVIFYWQNTFKQYIL